ncbi:hypothetical protein M501DRAFT_1002296 [Patellaria atrata CBS 101060]|uniref:Uncharacterized protein n=1 Tax=Patellaria atrata CBS 101060 TaxID=1346257 RepID=A0A9P4SCT4_9PEZI|nr:hypothetical protein M501DRAFT_1002296 [Patellaria atrata CBS 101060]
MAISEQVDWQADAYWNNRRLSPAQILVHDIRLESWRSNTSSMLEIRETLASTLLPALESRDQLESSLPVEKLTANRNEQHQLKNLVQQYGWMNCLRSQGVQEAVDDPDNLRKCRWIHISSKFTEYIQGCLLALLDWNDTNMAANLTSLRQLEYCISQQERFSKHGRYFAPFVQTLNPDTSNEDVPLLMSLPFLDWSVEGEIPPLRFQVDSREGYQSSRSSSHVHRSILQYFYRLEDTNDREHHQVFTKHKPWYTDHELDLKVRRWYGHYPSSLNVDELWVLVVDSRHIVTFSSNQSWKSRWPPLQLASRIMEISFRGIRNNFFVSEDNPDYTSYLHTIACLSGAVGIMHRSFWMDIPLCLTDRFAGYLGHLVCLSSNGLLPALC